MVTMKKDIVKEAKEYADIVQYPPTSLQSSNFAIQKNFALYNI